MKLPRRLVVVGAGLLGGSALACLQTRRNAVKITAVSSKKTLDGLRSRDWCDELFEYEDLAEACRRADLVLLCTPLSVIEEHLRVLGAVKERLAPKALVVDVGSTKAQICRLGFELFPGGTEEAPRFVGGHPMAGSERSGLGAADPLLFQSALWVLCPPHDFPHERLEPIKALIAALGARGAILEPVQHDQAVARVSHVPQIVSTALSGWAGSDERLSLAALALAAGGFRDMTRLALSSWEMWRDILATNPAPIASGLHEVAQRLSDLADGVAIGELAPLGAPDGEEIFRTAFADGRAFREKFRMPRKGIARDLSEFVVRLEDRPGQLLALLSPLAEADINVQDLEILKVREGETGTVLLGFGSAHERERARAALGDRFLVEDK